VNADDIRRGFLGFFEERGHRLVPSSSLIPPAETGLLLTTAGMVQFIPYLLGLQGPPYARATTSQKSFRAVDIDNVGHTDRHLTFFEMLGNFSFGDYFKREAIVWAHELVTEGYGIDPGRIWVTVYESDEEAMEGWVDGAGFPVERIVRRGRFDEQGEPANFWWTHRAGPCGPCSEIFVDRGPRHGAEGGPNVDEERYCEIWNLVFMQDECDDEANILRPLPRQNIDTGSSLERVAMVLQDVDNVFETDLLRPLLAVAEKLTGKRYRQDERADVSLRVIAEHGRATTFLMADGVLPSNEGRGYVLRRMLRRMITHARRLGVDRPITADLIGTTVELMGEAYPELVENQAFVVRVAASEEERFVGTFQHGMTLFEEEVRKARALGRGDLPAEAAFRLHDTFGFQQQLTRELAAEEGLSVDTAEFDRLMEEQRRRGQEAAKKGDASGGALGEISSATGPTESLAYERLRADGRLVGLVADGAGTEVAEEGQTVQVVLDRTPFYAEGGGQVGDAGIIRTASGVVEIAETRPGPGGLIVHEGRVASGEIRAGEEAEAEVDEEFRAGTTRSHTATHVLHHTLRQVLGEHARQAGSLITPGRLRFDFTHYDTLSRDLLEEIEGIANGRLGSDDPVRAYETTMEFARSQGAVALFGEKYGDLVRVVEVGDYSKELCGGTHVHHTGEVAFLRILHEASIGSGFRRIEALTGLDALKHVNAERRLLEQIASELGASDPAQAPERIRHLLAEHKRLQAELGKIQRASLSDEVDALVTRARDVDGVKLIVERVDGKTEAEIRELAPRIASRLSDGGADRGAVVLGIATEKGARIVASVTGGLFSSVTARRLLEGAGKRIGGGVGGKDRLAFAGGPKADAVDDALSGIPEVLASLIGGE
jgi:alanyl-tRNA synthetase